MVYICHKSLLLMSFPRLVSVKWNDPARKIRFQIVSIRFVQEVFFEQCNKCKVRVASVSEKRFPLILVSKLPFILPVGHSPKPLWWMEKWSWRRGAMNRTTNSARISQSLRSIVHQFESIHLTFSIHSLLYVLFHHQFHRPHELMIHALITHGCDEYWYQVPRRWFWHEY